MSEAPDKQTLRTDLRLVDPDGFYQALIDMTKGLTEPEALVVNAKLVLLLANHVGDIDVLRQAMTAARKGIDGSA